MMSIRSKLSELIDIRTMERKLLLRYGKRMPDDKYLKKLYKIKTGRTLDLVNPQTYTEKLQWLKIYDRNPLYTKMQDKYAVREYISNVIGDEYLIPLLGTWNNANDIEFDLLPDQFVLKCNHDCASVVICRDKKKLDFEYTRTKLNTCLKKNYYEPAREWAYKDIKPIIMAEKYMSDSSEKTLTDYKFFCFSGEAKMVLIASGEAHTSSRRLDYYDMQFNHLPIKRGTIKGTEDYHTKPNGFELLVTLAEKVAGNIPFIRVDFYLIDGHPYFGEVAFYPSAGLAEFYPYEWEKRVGEWIHLPQ